MERASNRPRLWNLQVRILLPQPAILRFGEFLFLRGKCPPIAGFRDTRKSLNCQLSNFCCLNSQKSLLNTRRIPVSRRLSLETEEYLHCAVGLAVHPIARSQWKAAAAINKAALHV